jgi:hypothetical protein
LNRKAAAEGDCSCGCAVCAIIGLFSIGQCSILLGNMGTQQRTVLNRVLPVLLMPGPVELLAGCWCMQCTTVMLAEAAVGKESSSVLRIYSLCWGRGLAYGQLAVPVKEAPWLAMLRHWLHGAGCCALLCARLMLVIVSMLAACGLGCRVQ